MKKHTYSFDSCKVFKYVEIDATNMNFKDNTFNLTEDKGTYDAIACNENDKIIIKNLFLLNAKGYLGLW